MLAREVRGNAEAVSSFLPPGANPHQFEPRPSDVRRAGQAAVVVHIGLGFDDWVLPLMQEVEGDPKSVLRCSEHVKLMPLAGVEALEEVNAAAAHSEAWDPHFWLDPEAAAGIGVQLAEVLAQQDPARADDYRSRSEQFSMRMAQLDADLSRQLKPLRGTRFIATHAGWAYFARRYGLEQVAVVELAPGREPGPRRLAHLMELARRENVQAIFSEVQLSDGSARVLASELNVPVIALDPLGGAGVPGRESIEDLLRWNAQRIQDVLEKDALEKETE
jgi:ABC-type Zn uptake system ZnuABC Zn-binding protein ZnuA